MRPWIVTPHERIVEHESNLWSVAGDTPTMKGMNRRMAIAKLRDGRLVFFNGIPLDDASMTKLAAWGKPWLLLLPHHSHMLDAHSFQEKLGLTTCAPDVELPRVQKRIPKAVGYSTITLDDTMRLFSFESSKLKEGCLVVRSGPRATAVLSDVVMNVRSDRFIFRLLGMTGGPKLVPPQKWLFVKDARLLKQELSTLAKEPGLARLVVSHGVNVETGASADLERIAAAL